MKIFMDTANVEEIREFADMGIVYGVTTNPSLIAKSGRTQAEVIPEICALIPGPVSAEVISQDCEGMVKEARELVKIADNVVVKIPCITEGLKAVKILAAEGIKTNVTLVFSLGQALLAKKMGKTRLIAETGAGRYRPGRFKAGGEYGKGIPQLPVQDGNYCRQRAQHGAR